MNKQHLKIAILDLYNGHPNQGMRGFHKILNKYWQERNIEMTWDVFDVRQKNELPGTDYDIYISSGGPGSPVDSTEESWDKNWCALMDTLHQHNESGHPDKKFVFFVCHSFQLLCRHWRLGDVCRRNSPSFGTMPISKTEAARSEELLEDLPDPFYAVDSRQWQVISPNLKAIEATGSTILAIEKERPQIPLERCIMAMRFNEYFFGTQFHPEADPEGMMNHLQKEARKEEVIAEHGVQKYEEMLATLADPDKISLTQHTILPAFLTQAIESLYGAPYSLTAT